MPMTVAEFYDDLRTVIARGTAVDTSIPIWSRSALRFLEREITFDYMKATFFLLLEPGAKFFDFGSQDPPIPLKRIEALGYFGQDGGMIPLARINVNSIGRNIAVIPNGYRQAGTKIFFEGASTPPGVNPTTVGYPLMLHTSLFSEWPSVGTSSHPILALADDLIKHQVLLQSVTSVRKQEEMAGWKLLRDEAIGSVRRLQDENELETNAQMEYWGGTTGRLFPNVSSAIAAIQGMYDVPDSFGVAGIYQVGETAGGSGHIVLEDGATSSSWSNSVSSTEPLINAGPGGVMEAGLAPARHPESVPFWFDGENVAFRNLGVEKAIGADHLLTIGKKVIRIAQAFVAGGPRAYYQTDDFAIFGWDGGFPYFIGQTATKADLIPYGSWLFVASNGLSVWKNEGAMSHVPGTGTDVDFGLRFKDHLLFSGNGTRVHWPDVRDPTNFTAGRNSTAGRLQLRDMGSNALCARPCGDGVALYSNDAMRMIKYAGAGVWFGEAGEPVNGIGAISDRSVVEAGFKNYGLNRTGFFITDGVSFQYIDTPAFHGYLESRLDWSKQSQVFGWHNEKFQEIMWVYPGVDGAQHGVAFKYTNGSFTRYKLPIYAADPKDAFSFPLIGTIGGLAYARGTANAKCFVRTKPLDAGNALRYKYFDNFRLVGKFSNGETTMRLGLHNTLNGAPSWVYEGPAQSSTFLMREAVFLTIEFATEEEPNFEISQILVTGNIAGDIFQ